ncbi:glycosyltransferase, partial [Streptomyces massasporeus]
MTTPLLLLVESNTTGTGRQFAARARDLGAVPVLLSADPARYPYAAEDGLRTVVVDTADDDALWFAVTGLAAAAPVAGVLSSSEYYVATAAGLAARLGLPALLDAVTTVTEADARAYRELGLPGVRVESVPNSVPAPPGPPADPAAKTVVAAGRLTRVKRYDLLIDAFAEVAADHPGWRLRIYGTGDAVQDLKGPLTRQIKERGLGEQVFLMGSATPLEPELAKGSIAAVTSQRES